MIKKFKSLKIPMALLIFIFVQGCTTVQPWERGTLARADMALSSDPLESGLNQHIYFAKEASSGGLESSGGGCGCN
ncbi:MAG: DUF4266 domain-containing protein [bacterium]